MKFGALLRSSAQEVPEVQGLFVCYKQLKKRLKCLPERLQEREPAALQSNAARANERAFVALLIADIQAFNETFVEREEQSVIQLSLIEERASSAHGPEQIAGVYKNFVDFHGQTLMLVHWSILAYTSVLKILKKHYKRTGLQVQEFNLQHLLSQPFCSVELISGLVRKAEEKAQELAARLNMGPNQASLSVASPASSSVAELISAARASVQELANSAAHGNEALDRHLHEQPTSSDDASADSGEGDVVSGPSQPQGERVKERQKHNAVDNTGRRSNAAAEQVRGSKRACEGCTDVDRLPKQLQSEAASGRAPTKVGQHHGTSTADAPDGLKLHRTASVAGESGIPNNDDGLSTAGQQPAEEAALPSDSFGSARGKAGGLPSSANGSSGKAAPKGSSESQGISSLRGSAQLTMGQGWGNGGSQNILRQTQMALGLWEQLHYTASTPSTVVPPLQPSKRARGSANSAA